MSATRLEGKELAANIRSTTSGMVQACRQKNIVPTLAIVIASSDESAQYYVRLIQKQAQVVGIETQISQLSPASSYDGIAVELERLARDSSVHGIILQTPLAPKMPVDDLRTLIPLDKDIDGANPLSAGRLFSGLQAFAPATAEAVMELLKWHNVELTGMEVAVVGRSRIVGKPVAHLMLDQNATVTTCHSKTSNLESVTSRAEILIVAIGKPGFIVGDHVKSGAVVIDVGTNVDTDGKLVGDVDPEKVDDVAAALSPVPGGIGPVTTALLLKHTALAATL